MCQNGVLLRQNVTEKSEEICPCATIFGMKIGNAQNAVKETDVTIMSP